MNRPARQLLDDMLGDSASPEFRAALMDKTLRSARQRKRVRRLNLVLGVTALAGVFVLTILELRAPTSVRNPLPQSDSLVANSQKLSSVPMVSTRQAAVENTISSDSSPVLTIVQTTEAARPREINDQQLLALLADKPAAPVYRGTHKAELILFNSEAEKGFPVQ